MNETIEDPTHTLDVRTSASEASTPLPPPPPPPAMLSADLTPPVEREPVVVPTPALELSSSMIARLPTLQTPVHSAPTRLSESLRDIDTQDAVASANAAAAPAALDPVELAPLTPSNLVEPLPAPAPTAAQAPASAPAPGSVPTQVSPPEDATPEPAKIVTGPSSIFAADPALAPLQHTIPALPTVQAPPAAPAPSAATPTPFSFEDLVATPSPASRKPKKRKSRWLVRLVVLGALGAGAYFGATEGPALYERYVEGVEPSTELAAPLAFPNTAASSTPVRTAEFTLTGLPETPGVEYRVTTDFETGVSQVDITRENGPDLQVLTFADDAMIRRVGSTQWYVLERGQFPLDGRLNRADWVRQLDELLPAAVRSQVVIDEATQSVISNVPTRRLSLTLDAGLLVEANPIAEATAAESAEDVAAPPAPAATDPTTVDPSNAVVPPIEPVASLPTSGTTQIDIWVDADGLIRQVTGAPQLGAETITIVRTTSEPWIPAYPTPEEITTLTASALVDLGI